MSFKSKNGCYIQHVKSVGQRSVTEWRACLTGFAWCEHRERIEKKKRF